MQGIKTTAFIQASRLSQQHDELILHLHAFSKFEVLIERTNLKHEQNLIGNV